MLDPARCPRPACFAVTLILLWGPAPAAADAVTAWNVHANDAVNATCIGPSLNGPAESRLYAMVHIAIHDAVNAIAPRSRPYAYTASADPSASLDAAVAAAARDVLVGVIGQLPPDCAGTGAAVVEAAYAAALALIPPGAARDAGIGVGQASAAAILALRANDGSDTPLVVTDFPQGDDPGEYRFTPGFDFVFAPGWGDVTPFALERGSQFRPRPPHPIRSQTYVADFGEVKALGGDGVTTPSTRTPEQTEIGLFWRESSPQQWNRIARAVSEDEGLALWENARLFALLNVALADGYIGSWEAKYHYLFWRPVTAIQLAETDGNPRTAADPTWTPLQFTYPIPDYDSGHAVQGGAAAGVLTRFFGTDAVSFDVCSFTLPAGSTCADASPVFRSYSSFSQAATDNSLSRIYIGIHFRDAVEQGERHGRRIADWAVNQFFQVLR